MCRFCSVGCSNCSRRRWLLRAPVVVDATLGLGGHAEALLIAHPQARLIGIDRDTDALALATARLAPFETRITLVHAVYDQLPRRARRARTLHGRRHPVRPRRLVAAARRGRARVLLRQDAPLDMRMDRSTGKTAADVVNTYSAAELARVLRVYGEERFAPRIADAIVQRARVASRSTSAARLAELVRDVDPRRDPADRRPPGEAHVPGPAHRGQRRARGARTGDSRRRRRRSRSVAGSWCCRTSRSRTVSSSTLFAAGAASTSPSELPVELPDHAPRLRLLTRGAETGEPC